MLEPVTITRSTSAAVDAGAGEGFWPDAIDIDRSATPTLAAKATPSEPGLVFIPVLRNCGICVNEPFARDYPTERGSGGALGGDSLTDLARHDSVRPGQTQSITYFCGPPLPIPKTQSVIHQRAQRNIFRRRDERQQSRSSVRQNLLLRHNPTFRCEF